MNGFRVYDTKLNRYVTEEHTWVVNAAGKLFSVECDDLIEYPECIKENDSGLEDRAKNEIFEGDIIKTRCGIGVVKYAEKYELVSESDYEECFYGIFGWYVSCGNQTADNEKEHTLTQYMIEGKCNIVGNIHKDSALLETGTQVEIVLKLIDSYLGLDDAKNTADEQTFQISKATINDLKRILQILFGDDKING